MAEQISHKKSLRVNRLNKDRRQLLKEYYKLESVEQENNTDNPNETVVETENTSQIQSDESGEPVKKDVDKSISDQTFKELVQTHNSLLKKETETNNSIKNTIYENYYDLIKVDDLLKGILDANQSQLSELKKTVDMLKG